MLHTFAMLPILSSMPLLEVTPEYLGRMSSAGAVRTPSNYRASSSYLRLTCQTIAKHLASGLHN